ncbi:hypothetical protein WDJ51_15105 [Rathayibacter sp. YIM 133350]|uniref:hypothetical protein n=1 Tax=Rathayibacter sp. YIM 133350 TaxID=3131992 RepID=UPI00307D0487
MVEWHPILAAHEPTAGRWELRDESGRRYGLVVIVRRGGEVGYRAEDAAGELIGHYTNLRAACREVHNRFVRAHGESRFSGYPKHLPLA